MILTGSRAIISHFPDFKRECKDFDYITDVIPTKKEKNTEYHIIPILYDLYASNLVLPPDVIYTLKCSHISHDIKWDKHIYDIQFLKSKGCKIDKKLFYNLYSFWNTYHKEIRRPDFNMNNSEFFSDKVERLYHHDDLHEIIKYTDSPLFNLIKIDKSKAEIDENIFSNTDFETQLKIVREESYVIALERFLIPKVISNPISAYSRALKSLITRLSPIWLVLFIVDNYTTLSKPDIEYYKIFKNYESQRN